MEPVLPEVQEAVEQAPQNLHLSSAILPDSAHATIRSCHQTVSTNHVHAANTSMTAVLQERSTPAMQHISR